MTSVIATSTDSDANVTITDLRQTAVSTTAGTFTLNGLSLKLNVGAKPRECF